MAAKRLCYPCIGDVPALFINIINAQAKTWAKLVSPWRSPKLPVLFVEKMDTQIGLLGRDILQRWSAIGFLPRSDSKGQGGKRSWTITIEL
jgi:hypothetical protein